MNPYKIALTFVVLCAMILTLSACGIGDRPDPPPESTIAIPPTTETILGQTYEIQESASEVDESDASDFLDRVIPACIPYPGSSVDPSERRDTWDLLTSHYISSQWTLLDEAPSLEESYMRLNDGSAAFAPQIVVRMIPIPGTTRCAKLDSFGSFSWVESEAPSRMYEYTQCFVDLAINEYIIGVGPARLQINMGVWPYNYTGERLRAEEDIFANKFEGVEWIAFLTGPTNPAHAAWRLYWHLDVQKRDDGEVVVVNYLRQFYDTMSLPEFAAINASRTESTLTDYRAKVKSAHTNYYAMTGGRIGTGLDFYGNPLPFAASEATEAALDDYIGQIKAVEGVDYTVSKPPPSPGGDNPNPDGLRINDIIATRVAGGVRIPSGMEDTPTPASALGDASTATTEPTAEPTATAHPDPIATPELEDTPAPETAIQRRRTLVR